MRFLTTRRIAAAAVVLALATGGGALTDPAGAAPETAGVTAAAPAAAPAGPSSRPACDTPAARHARCFALVRTDAGARAAGARADSHAALPAGLGPRDLESAYNLPTTRGRGQTVAVVDAFDDPTAEADLATYRSTFGLPACTTANGCFKKLDQAGRQGHYPAPDSGWAVEISLDLDMVSAACPHCAIVLVETNTNSLDDLAAGVDTAVSAGAHVVSNSYGTDEFHGMWPLARHYIQPGAAVLASSGDFGFTAAQFPAVVPSVTAVGGTSLTPARNARGWSERAWSGAGSGCSAYTAKPGYQRDTHCGMRTVADISAVADPDTGPAVYDTTPNPYGVPPGWLIVGGTSASAPFIAGVIGLAGNGSWFHTGRIYRHVSATFDVVGGSNGFCGGDYLCTGVKGYDGPTGVGSPNGVGAL